MPAWVYCNHLEEYEMATEFEQDLEEALEGLNKAHQELLKTVESVSETDLDNAKRGEWSVRAMLAHIAASERHYAHIVNTLRDQESSNETPARTPASVAEAVQQLDAQRQALLAAVQGVDEDTFYRLRHAVHQEYSVLSVLRDSASHQREHLGQIQETLPES